MVSNAPVRIGPSAETLKIEDWKESNVIDDILDFIKVNGVVDVHDITIYVHGNQSPGHTLKSILSETPSHRLPEGDRS
jgi:hypothetical protein